MSETATSESASILHARTNPAAVVEEYVTRGLVILHPDDLGVPHAIHEEIYAKEKIAFAAHHQISAGLIPEVLQITNSPGVVQACDALLGPNWAVVPFTHNTPFPSGSNDQHWHKDDNGPFNMRKQRHHHAVQVEMLYYPQEVRADMGPTATVPYSQYWTFNHEENHDNFAGADHLDFSYQISGMERIPVSGPKSTYDVEDIVGQKTAHDKRMRRAVLDLNWPLCAPYEAGPLAAGSVILYSHNLLHRGNHRRDDWRLWKGNPRFLWRFWLYRTTEPQSRSIRRTIPLARGIDELTGQDHTSASADVRAVWDYQYRWLSRERTSTPEPSENDVDALDAQLHLKGDRAEPKRIGAGYRLAEIGASSSVLRSLANGLNSDRESVRRAAMYGLIALGDESLTVFLQGAKSPARWVRRASVFGLGESGAPFGKAVSVLQDRLLNDPSVYVRSVAADAIGCIGRRAVARGDGASTVPACLNALMDSFEVEENRLSMDRAQSRSIKFVRPTDDCDVCEGIGFDFGQDRYDPVRSVVRENAGWATVILCSHGLRVVGDAFERTVTCLKGIIQHDKNVFTVGLAMDALTRLSRIGEGRDDPQARQLEEELPAVFASSPIFSLEPLVQAGLSVDEVTRRYGLANRAELLA